MTFEVAIQNVPSVAITSPTALAVVKGSIAIAADASGGSGGIAQVEFFVNGSSIEKDTAAPYSATWNAAAQAPGKYRLKAVATDGTGVKNSSQEFVHVVTGSSKVLIIDLGSTNNSGEAIADAAARGTMSSQCAAALPAAVDPSYAAVFVCLEYYPQNHVLTEAESGYLSNYLSNGGRLYLEGGDTWAYDDILPIHNYFGIKGVDDGDEWGDLQTGGSSGLADRISFSATGINTSVDQLEPVNGGAAIWRNSSPSYITGVSKRTATSRTVGCSFEFSNISGESLKTKAMSAYLAFFGVIEPYPANEFLPAVFKLLL